MFGLIKNNCFYCFIFSVLLILSGFGCVSSQMVNKRVEEFKNGDKEHRLIAAKQLVEYGEISVYPLMDLASDKDSETRALVAWSLGEIGSESSLECLIELLGDKDEKVRISALEAVSKFGSESVPHLENALNSGNSNVKKNAVELLVSKGSVDSVPEILPLLGDKDKSVSRAAGKALLELSPDSIPHLVSALAYSDGSVREPAVALLIAIGDPASDYIIEALGNMDKDQGMRAVYILGQIGSPDAVEPLFSLLKATDKMDYKRAIIFALGCFKKKAVDFLSEEIDSPSYITRAGIAETLGYADCREAIDPLIKLSQDKEALVRAGAVLSLGRLGFTDEKVIAVLIQALKDKESSARHSGALAFDMLKWKFRNKKELASYYVAKQDWNKAVELKGASAEALVVAMKDRKEWIRKSAAAALVEIGPAAVENLSSDVDMDDPRMLSSLLIALGKIKSPKAIPLMKKTAGHPDWLVRNATARALGNIPSAKSAPLLKKLSRDPERIVRTNAMKSLGRARSFPVGDLLTAGLEDDEWLVRKNSAESLGRSGDKKFIPDLRKALGDPNELVRAGAAKALIKLGWTPVSDKEKFDYYFALQDWGKLKQMKKDIIPGLESRMKDKNSAIRCRIVDVIGCIGDPDSIDYLRDKLMSEKAFDVKKASAKALLNYGVGAVPAYSKALETGDPLARKLSAGCLGLVKY